MGISVHAREDIEPKAKLISCPRNLAITWKDAQSAIVELYPSDTVKRYRWHPMTLMAFYLCLHWIHQESSPPG
jgi:hypothetical protein